MNLQLKFNNSLLLYPLQLFILTKIFEILLHIQIFLIAILSEVDMRFHLKKYFLIIKTVLIGNYYLPLDSTIVQKIFIVNLLKYYMNLELKFNNSLLLYLLQLLILIRINEILLHFQIFLIALLSVVDMSFHL